MTLVCTDVEGSTEMWEWDNKAMMEAISLHDRVMRMHMAKFGGYEVGTEGDAFVIAFHTPGKAVAWAAATQQVSCNAFVHLRPVQIQHSLMIACLSAVSCMLRGQITYRACSSEIKNHRCWSAIIFSRLFAISAVSLLTTSDC